jgi:hypothetical protein
MFGIWFTRVQLISPQATTANRSADRLDLLERQADRGQHVFAQRFSGVWRFMDSVR